jgi:uncharacterized protein (TIGR04255 family)
MSEPFRIDLTETFEHLSRSPIVEAVIDIRARATQPWEKEPILEKLRPGLQGYGYLGDEHEFSQDFKLQNPEKGISLSEPRDMGLKSLRFQSDDKKQIALFNRDGFVFSRLEPYQDWDHLHAEGLRLWQVYRETAQSQEIERIGVRSINRIPMAPGDQRFEDYFDPAPQPPRTMGDVPFASFLHQEALAIPEHPYVIVIRKTIQQQETQGTVPVFHLFLDIDVATTPNAELAKIPIVDHLAKMRWLKNKTFLGCITKKARERFQ